MQGNILERSKWKINLDKDSMKPNRRIRVFVMLPLLALFVTMFLGLAMVKAAPADALTCSTAAWNPWKKYARTMKGGAEVFCSRAGTSKYLYMAVHRNVNNFPDPKVCSNDGSKLAF